MALSAYSILLPPFVSLQATPSTQGFTKLQEDYNFGTVDSINASSWRVQVGASCLFKRTDAVFVTVGNANYYIVDENKLLIQENE